MTGDGSPVLKKAPGAKGGVLEKAGKGGELVVKSGAGSVKAAEAAGEGSEDLRASLEEARARAEAAESKIKAMQELAEVKSPRARSLSGRSRSRSKRSWDGRSRRPAAGRRSRDRRSRSRDRRSRSKGRRSRSKDRRSRDRSPRGRRSRDRSPRGRRSRDRSSKDRRSRSRELNRRLERMEQKVEKSSIKWNKMANEKQNEWNQDLKSVLIDDMGVQLERLHGNELPDSLITVLNRGKKIFEERSIDLRRSDKYSWRVVELFKRDPLCETETDEKRLRRAVKDEEDERKSMAGQRGKGVSRAYRGAGGRGAFGGGRGGGYGGGFGGGLYGGRGYGGGAFGGGHGAGGYGGGGYGAGSGGYSDASRYSCEYLDQTVSVPLSPGPVTPVGSSATCAGTARGGARPGAGGEGARLPRSTELCSEPSEAFNITEIVHAESAENKLDRLEGVISLGEEGVKDHIVMFEDDVDVDMKVTKTLKEHYAFWEETNASEFAKSVIRNGYIPSLSSLPQKYEEPNNRSYVENKVWANEAVGKLLKTGVIEKVVKSELVCVNPLSVAFNAKGKPRLCIDLSRCYNLHSKAVKFRIESTQEVLKVIRKGDWMASFDLKSAYLQVPVNENYVQFLGFAVERERGVKEYFRYIMMPFGLNDAARVLTKLMRSPLERWRAMGIKCFIHLDDGFIFCGSKEETLEASRVVRQDLINYGLLISESKCSWGARRSLEWTGFIFDTVSFQLWVPEAKLVRAQAKVEGLLVARSDLVSVRDLASLAGLLVSFGPAMGEVVRFNTRAMMIRIAEVTEVQGWSAKIELGYRVVEELLFWRQNIVVVNGHIMRKEDKVISTETREMFSDASEFLLGGAQFSGDTEVLGTRYQACLLGSEVGMSSTYRELRAVEEGLKLRGSEFRGHLVRWGCDNWAAANIIRLGSMKPDCHEVAKRISQLAKQFEVQLEAFWLRRNSVQIQICDEISKDFDTSDYKLSSVDFDQLRADFGPFSVDFFASSFSRQFSPFYARLACSEAEGADAFSVSWSKPQFGFFHPPVGLVVKVLRYAEMCRASGLLVVPDWQGSVFMVVLRELMARRKVWLARRFRPVLQSPPWLKSKTFSGVPKFDFLAIMMDF